jgi:hypothetical protein
MNEADKALAERAALHDSIFTTDDALECRLERWQIEYRARNVWKRLYPRVFLMPGAPLTWKGELRAACFAGEPHATLSHRTAAKLYDLPGGRGDLVEVAWPRWRRSQTSNLIVHESTLIHPNDIQLVDELPVVTPERAVLDLASIYKTADYVERVLHAARRNRLITYESMTATFERLAGRGRRGIAALREALERWPLSQRPSDSDMETLLLQVLRQHQLPEPVLQYVVYDQNGLFVARADAALVEYRVLIEYDSKQEHSDEWALARDATRRNRCLALGYWPLTARHHDLRNGGNTLVRDIRGCIRRSRLEPA